MGSKNSFREFWSRFQVIVIFIMLIIIYSLLSPNFFTAINLRNISGQNAALIIVAIGQLLCQLVGGVDLSVSSVLAYSGVLAAKVVITNGDPLWMAILFCTMAGLGFGLLNGFLVSYCGFAPFIATLGITQIAKGMAFVACSAKTIYMETPVIQFIGKGLILGTPVVVLIALAIALIFGFILRKTVIGRRLYTVGGNAEAAMLSGINVKGYKFFAFATSGCLAGIAGFLAACRLGAGAPTTGMEIEMDSIAACVIGNVLLYSGYGTVFNTVLGALTIGWIKNIMNLLGVASYPQYIVKGVIIVIAVMGQRLGSGSLVFKIRKTPIRIQRNISFDHKKEL